MTSAVSGPLSGCLASGALALLEIGLLLSPHLRPQLFPTFFPPHLLLIVVLVRSPLWTFSAVIPGCVQGSADHLRARQLAAGQRLLGMTVTGRAEKGGITGHGYRSE